FSYRVPFEFFTRRTEVWDMNGRRIALVADQPVSDDVPRQGVPIGPRHVQWQPLHDSRLIWATALDRGDPKVKVPYRDKTLALDQPFTGEPTPLVLVEHRFVGFAWLPARDQVLLTEFDRDRRWRRTAQMDLTRPEQSRRVLFDLSVNDAYKNPGS